MAEKTRQPGFDERLTFAIARGLSRSQAAREAGCSVRTVQRRLQLESFRETVREARSGMLSQAVGMLAAASSEAVLCLRHLLTGGGESVRLGAARAILEAAVKFRESEELEARIAELENQIKENADEQIS